MTGSKDACRALDTWCHGNEVGVATVVRIEHMFKSYVRSCAV